MMLRIATRPDARCHPIAQLALCAKGSNRS
ncbi:hypothetical protein MPLB_1510078 [Mesorhizobium sp. ORS 3324]|nr:hypothetical protein MPLB_1510078 [Mesorhizobium sp. ORS 3324]